MVVMNSTCKCHLNALGIKQTIQADEYGFLWTTTNEICIKSIPAVYNEYGFFF